MNNYVSTKSAKLEHGSFEQEKKQALNKKRNKQTTTAVRQLSWNNLLYRAVVTIKYIQCNNGV